MASRTPAELESYDELLTASGGDTFVRWSVDPAEPVRGWLVPGGVAFLRAVPSPRRSLTVVTSLREAVAVVPSLVQAVPDAEWLTLPRGAADPLADLTDPGVGADWEWMHTCAAPPRQPLEERVVPLGAADEDDVRSLLAQASPRHSAPVGGPDIVAWYGVRDRHGVLLACAAHSEHVPGVPHLASIATLPSARGQGLGAALTAVATRAALAAGRPVVTLGLYADNDVAGRLYQRLGFRCEHRWSSRRLRRRSTAP